WRIVDVHTRFYVYQRGGQTHSCEALSPDGGVRLGLPCSTHSMRRRPTPKGSLASTNVEHVRVRFLKFLNRDLLLWPTTYRNSRRLVSRYLLSSTLAERHWQKERIRRLSTVLSVRPPFLLPLWRREDWHHAWSWHRNTPTHVHNFLYGRISSGKVTAL